MNPLRTLAPLRLERYREPSKVTSSARLLLPRSVSALLTEHTLEHIKFEFWPKLLREFHRILRVGGVLRVAVPDYHAPGPVRRVFWNDTEAREHHRLHGHHAFTSFVSMRPLIDASPFGAAYWLHYYDGTALDSESRGRPPREDAPLPFVRTPINYDHGFVKRTPDHPGMNDNVTSVVVDLIKLAGDPESRVS